MDNSASSTQTDLSTMFALDFSSLDDLNNSSLFEQGGEFDPDSAFWSAPSCTKPADPFAAFEPVIEALHDDAAGFGELFRELVDFELSSESLSSEPSSSVALTFLAIKCDLADGSASPLAVDARLDHAPATLSPLKIETVGKKRSTSGSCKTSSQRQKEEIALLRDSAARLEEELAELRAKCCQAASDTSARTNASASAIQPPMQPPMWEGFARRQRDARQKAEHENAELRRELRTTMRAAKSLERSLHKRQRTCE